MNAIPIPPRIEHARRSGVWDWIWVCLGIVVFYGLLAWGVTSFFRLNGDAAALKNAVLSAAPPGTEQMITVNVGPLTTGAVRAGLSFIHLPPEARAGIQTLRSAEVSVYKLGQSLDCFDPQKAFAGADKVMKQRRWTRVVGVVKDGAFVAVYMPSRTSSPEKLRCCVAVLNDRDLVVAGVRGDLVPLMEVVQKRLAEEIDIRQVARR
jgi:hypothetical protein